MKKKKVNYSARRKNPRIASSIRSVSRQWSNIALVSLLLHLSHGAGWFQPRMVAQPSPDLLCDAGFPSIGRMQSFVMQRSSGSLWPPSLLPAVEVFFLHSESLSRWSRADLGFGVLLTVSLASKGLNLSPHSLSRGRENPHPPILIAADHLVLLPALAPPA